MDQSKKIFLFIISVLAVAAGFYVYRPQGLFFLADDFIHIPESASNIWAQRNSLRPIGNISLHLDFLFSNTSALGYHITNLLLHVLNSFFVFLLVRVLIRRYDTANPFGPMLSGITAVVFFVYPFHSESIFWIIGRSGSLGALFFLPALILYVQRHKSISYFIASVLCFILALLAYESSWVFPLLVAVIAYMDASKNTVTKQREMMYAAIVWLVFILFLALRFKVTGQVLNQYDTGTLLSLNMKNLIANFFRLFARTLLPPFVQTRSLLLYFVVALLLIIAVTFKFFRHRQPRKLFLFISVCWLLSYLPYLSLGIDTHGVEGERYLYLPSVFFCFWLLYVFNGIFSKAWFVPIVTVWLCINILFLQQSRCCYTKAGFIEQTTIAEVYKLSNKQSIFIEYMPQYNKGAVVFRLGFEEAMQWLHPSFAPSIFIVSKDDSDEKIREQYSNTFRLIHEIDTSRITVKSFWARDKSNRTGAYSLKDTVGLQYNPATDTWLRFTDTSLIISP